MLAANPSAARRFGAHAYTPRTSACQPASGEYSCSCDRVWGLEAKTRRFTVRLLLTRSGPIMGQALEDMDAVPLADKALTISAAQPAFWAHSSSRSTDSVAASRLWS